MDKTDMPVTTGIETRDGYELFPPGWYTVEIEGFEERDTKSGDSKYLNVEFKHLKTGRKLWGMLSYKDSALWKLAEFKEAAEIPHEETDLTPYITKKLTVKAKIEEYEGKYRNKVIEYKPYKKPTLHDGQFAQLLAADLDKPKKDDDDTPF